MNIFYLDNDLTTCAKYHTDKHVVKMILELAQLLCSAHWSIGNTAPYKKTHINHPSSLWTRQSKQNYIWLCKLAKELCKEYTYRYTKIHKTESVIDWCADNIPELPEIEWSQPTPVVPEQYKEQSDSVKSYRNYYRHDKIHLHKWKNREIPYWILETKQP